ncbi:acyltransferase [Haloferax massiliensis]|uniref:Galactoside O-acetyltransferase n=1 Tax=Haloferax massiliensis TaxID=1476858 RepID=A0A0D6JM90_9EURY|nr:acyltransferase [Haloferax massiliensis]CQR48735.1 Galactoside O-acetyltransferase [Haloferax massiliensis]
MTSEKARRILKIAQNLGPSGLIKSVYNSKKYTGSFASLITSKRTTIDVAAVSNITVNGVCFYGLSPYSPITANLHRSLLTTSRDSKFTIDSPNTPVYIGSGSKINVSGNLSIGEGSRIGDRATINCLDSISIGTDCSISWDVDLADSDFHPITIQGDTKKMTEPIEIGDHVWIGYGASIKKGVTIGDGAVIASDSVVTRDVPERSLAAGVPAKVIKTDVSWER